MKPVELNTNYEIPVYNEFIVKNRDKFVNFLKKNDVQTEILVLILRGKILKNYQK